MGLFAQEPGSEVKPTGVQRYTGWTREIGTRNVILWFAAIVALWFVTGKIQDHFLLKTSWPELKPQAEGLTVVGTLDSKDYDHNLFRVVTANQTSRVELTEYGWNTIFDDKNGPLFDPLIGNTIKSVAKVDNDTSFRMLEPYLRAGVAHAMGRADFAALVAPSTPVTVQVQTGKTYSPQETTLGALIKKYSYNPDKGDERPNADTDVGAGDNGHSVDHGLPIPADSLRDTSPVVLVGADFTGADLVVQPATMFDGKTYQVVLNLSREGRSRFFQWSTQHEHENLVFILNNRVVASGRIKQQMDVNTWEIGPLHDEETAKMLVDYVSGLKR